MLEIDTAPLAMMLVLIVKKSLLGVRMLKSLLRASVHKVRMRRDGYGVRLEHESSSS